VRVEKRETVHAIENFTPWTELEVKASIVSDRWAGSDRSRLADEAGTHGIVQYGQVGSGVLTWNWGMVGCRRRDVCRTVRSRSCVLSISGWQQAEQPVTARCCEAPSCLKRRRVEGKPLLLDFCRTRREPKTESRNASKRRNPEREKGQRGGRPLVSGRKLRRRFTKNRAA